MGYADFCLLVQKSAVVTLVISGVTRPIFINFAQDVSNTLPLNIFESEWRYYKPFLNTNMPNERIYPNFTVKLVAMAISREESEKEVRIVHNHASTDHLVKKS